jgi:hypothetical protein
MVNRPPTEETPHIKAFHAYNRGELMAKPPLALGESLGFFLGVGFQTLIEIVSAVPGVTGVTKGIELGRENVMWRRHLTHRVIHNQTQTDTDTRRGRPMVSTQQSDLRITQPA